MQRIITTSFVLAALFCASCEKHPASSTSSTATSPSPNPVTATQTVGNHSYVRLNLSGDPDTKSMEILNALDQFEKGHPNVRITKWWVYYISSSGTAPVVYGIFIDHQPCNCK